MQRAPRTMLGQILDGRYQILQLLGEGGMGSVYAAVHLGTGRRVAVKVIAESLAATTEVIIRFEREARAVGAVDTEHIVQVLDSGVDRRFGISFMVMEHLSGGDLRPAIRNCAPMYPELALRIAAQVCIGLQKAHEAGVVHRDIKPANLFLARRHAQETTVKLLDFGIAKMKTEQQGVFGMALTRTGRVLGSPAYASPEQARGLKTIDHRTDIWSLGAVLYEMLTGSTPHGELSTFGEIVMAVCSTPVRPIRELAPWVSREVATIVHSALTINVAARIPSAAIMLAAIRPMLPQGWWLSDRMFVPMSAEFRAHQASEHREVTDAVTLSVPTKLDPRRSEPPTQASPLAESIPPSTLYRRGRAS